MKKFILYAGYLLLLPAFLLAEIRETTRFEDLLEEADEQTLVLIDMDDTLTDSSISLGSSDWRHFLRKHFKRKIHPVAQIDIHDYYSYLIAKKVPVKTVESNTAEVVDILQKKKIATLCLTARGQQQWYSTTLLDIQELSQQQLSSVGIDFKRSTLPDAFTGKEITGYADGMLFSANQPKGEFLKELFTKLGYTPKRVILIDDKEEQILSAEEAMKEMNIPFLGLWYRHIEEMKPDYNPQIGNVQLERFLQDNTLLSDEEAALVTPPLPPEEHLKQIIESQYSVSSK